MSSPSEKEHAGKAEFSMKASKTDWKRVQAKKDSEIRTGSAHPEADNRHIMRKIVRSGLKPVQSKASISLRLDVDVLDWFKAQGSGYQTRINSILRAFKEASSR